MAKNKKHKFREIEKLPANAMSVSNYAKEVRNCNTSYIYQLIREKKNSFEIVEFQGVNFIIP
jgi:hypothetical protein